jgi:hypothetical protein
MSTIAVMSESFESSMSCASKAHDGLRGFYRVA